MPIHMGARGRWGWLLVVGCLGALGLHTRRATAEAPGPVDAPAGTLAFFVGDAQVCPAGWRTATEAQGRLAVAVSTADTVGKQVGEALKSQEDRTHVHPFATKVALSYKALAAANGGNRQGAAADEYTDSGTSEPVASGLPFIQLLTCVKL